MNDLSSLMQIAPITGAGFAGIQQAQSEQDEQLKQMELAQLIKSRMSAEQRLNEMHPLELQAKTLGNQETSARIPGILAQSDSYRTKADIENATKDSTIAKDNFSNTNGMRQAVFGQLGTFTPALQNTPAVGRHAALDSYLTSIGVPDSQKQQMMSHFANVPAEQLPAYVQKVSDIALRSTPAYAQEMDKVGAETKSREKVANILATSRESIADKKGNGKPDPNDIEANLRMNIKGKPPATQLAFYNTAITQAVQQGNSELALRLYAEATPIKKQVDQAANVPRAGTPAIGQLSNGQIPVNPSADMPLVQPGQQPPPQQPLISPNSSNDVRSAVEKAGERYQPDLYDYKVVNGQLMKRKKQ